MNKRIGFFLGLFFYVVFCFSQTNYYVASTGNDMNSGTETAPFKTIAKALKSFDASLGGTCFIMAGSYHERISITGKNNITIQPYNSDIVILDGTVEIKSSWTQNSENAAIYETTLSQDIWQLFIDKEQQVMARWPNAQFTDASIFDHFNWAKATNGSDGTSSTHIKVDTNGYPDLATSGINAQGAMVIANVGNWKTWARTVTNHSIGQNEFDYTQAGSFVNVHNYFYLECKKELIDTNNEWYYDMTSKKLYVYGNPTGKTIKGKTQSYAFNFLNSSNITIQGLYFFGTTVKFENATNGTVDNCHFAFPSCSKRMLKSEDTPETTSFLSNVSTVRNYLIRNCLFEHIDGEAMYLEGKGNTIENCYFQYVDYSCASTRYGQNTIVNTGENFKVTKCTLHTLGASQGLTSRKTGADFSYNDISNTGLAQSDGATMGAGQNKGDGTRIHHNWVHDTRKNGIRFDAPFGQSAIGGQNGGVDHNVVWNCGAGIKMKGNANHIYNNTVFNNNGIDISILNESMDDPDNPGSTLWSNQNTVTRNNLAGQISGHRSNPESLGGLNVIPGTVNNNVYSRTSAEVDVIALLEDPNKLDFRPKESSSTLIDRGVVDDTSPFIPKLTVNSLGLPDVGAYELGGDPWVAGVTWTPDFYPWGVLDSDVDGDDDNDGVMNNLDNCLETPIGEQVDANGCSLIASNNFTIEVISETCPNKNNGQLKIFAQTSRNYTASMNGNDYNFTSNKTIKNLVPGDYELCIMVPEQTLSNCYNFTIKKGVTVAGKSSTVKNINRIEIIEGTAPYKVVVNGIEILKTQSSSFDVEVKQGDLIEVSTAVFCEGVYLKKVSLFNEMKIYPNPTEDKIYFQFNENVPIEKVVIYNLFGQKIIETSGENKEVDIKSLNKGVYLLRVNTESGDLFSKKIIVKNI